MFPIKYQILFKRLAWLLLFYQLFRVAFYFFNQDVFAEITAANLTGVFLHGLRFDASAIVLINLPFIALSLFTPEKKVATKKFQKWLLVLYAAINIPFFYLNLTDMEYFQFIGRRTTNELFTITQDILEQANHLFLDYWYFFLATLFLGFLLIKFYPAYRPEKIPNDKYTLLQNIMAVLFFAIVCVVIIRGGTQYKPLNVGHALVHEPAVLSNLALNSTFTFVRSLDNVTLERKAYFKSQEEAARYLQFDPDKYLHPTEPPVRDNVVILILESFGSEYTGIENDDRGYTPFFDSLAAQGTLFRENYANGRRSILAVPSILAGLPSLMDDSFISSGYESNQLYGLGSILEPAGYATSFFHGAANGSMSFDAFTKQIGIKKYYGLNEYPKNLRARDFDGLWGIFDEPFLQFTVQQLSREKQPFATTIFTLSSHDPYTLPEQYQGRFPKGPLPLHETLGYTDHALRQFFKAAAQQPWYDHTLFILTGDHTQKTRRPGYKNTVAQHKVPLLLFHPSKSFAYADPHKVTQHVDILPTIVDYLNIPTNKLLPFGQSVLDTTQTGRALYYASGMTSLVKRDYITLLRPNDEVKLYGYRTHGYDYLKKPVPSKEQPYNQELKALVQYYRNGLVDNNLYYWLEKEKTGTNTQE
ncbi:MAG: sulfatase [Cytophagales bacterium CG18_big_fil_WC_8_21_14_2_50_42_9]|nr:MAG: sulfatase [Cytophagales bacterium CG18_big_fil_WC_8_21_14_2_50_42_9]